MKLDARMHAVVLWARPRAFAGDAQVPCPLHVWAPLRADGAGDVRCRRPRRHGASGKLRGAILGVSVFVQGLHKA